MERGPGGLGKGLELERGLGGMRKGLRKGLENVERAPVGASQCAPRGVCVCCSVCNCLGGRVWTCVRARVPVFVSVSARLNVCMSCMFT